MGWEDWRGWRVWERVRTGFLAPRDAFFIPIYIHGCISGCFRGLRGFLGGRSGYRGG